MRFLVATDGSEEGDRAVEHAARAALAHGAGLDVVHVVDSETRAGPGGADEAPGPPERGEAVLDRAAEIAGDIASEHDEELSIDTELRTGRPASAIIEYADEVDADALYLGHRVRPAQREAVVGSVAKDVLDRATMPVTIVP